MVVAKFPDMPFLADLPISSIEENLEPLFSKLLGFCRPLCETDNFKEIDRYLKEVMPNYIGLKWIMFSSQKDIPKESGEVKPFMRKVNSEIYEYLNGSDPEMFTKSDRLLLSEILSFNMKLADLLSKIPEENASYLTSALIDAWGTLNKIDLILTTIILIINKNIEIDDKSIIHKLCQAIKHYYKEVNIAFFMNNPVLVNRLRKPCKCISNKDMERLLELSN
jgi:hypothetical protein